MSDPTFAKSRAVRATDERFLRTVMSDDRDYPNGSEFVASSTDDLGEIINRKMREHRATVIVHDDGSDVVIEPPELRWVALLAVLFIGVLLRDRTKPSIEASGEVIQLPAASRLRLHPPSAVAA